MGKTKDLFKKTGNTKGTFHAKMGTIKDRNGINLTEPEDIKKRRQKYTKELYKKGLNDPNNQNDVVRARHPGIGSQVNIGSQVGLRKHYYEQN